MSSHTRYPCPAHKQGVRVRSSKHAAVRITRNQAVSSAKVELAKRLRRTMTFEERMLWQAIRNNALSGLHFRRQQVIAGFIVDFYCASARLAIEVDGDLTPNPSPFRRGEIKGRDKKNCHSPTSYEADEWQFFFLFRFPSPEGRGVRGEVCRRRVRSTPLAWDARPAWDDRCRLCPGGWRSLRRSVRIRPPAPRA